MAGVTSKSTRSMEALDLEAGMGVASLARGVHGGVGGNSRSAAKGKRASLSQFALSIMKQEKTPQQQQQSSAGGGGKQGAASSGGGPVGKMQQGQGNAPLSPKSHMRRGSRGQKGPAD